MKVTNNFSDNSKRVNIQEHNDTTQYCYMLTTFYTGYLQDIYIIIYMQF